jgi:hypothetical protein
VSTRTTTHERAPSIPLDPTARTRARGLRRPLIVLGIVVIVAVMVAIGRAGGAQGYLDPDAATPAGARALRVLLEDNGVQVTTVASVPAALAAAGPGGTLLLATPDGLGSRQLDLLAAGLTAPTASTATADGPDLVLVDPAPEVLARLAPYLKPLDAVADGARDPTCDLPAALRAGRAVTGGVSFDGRAPAGGSLALCYAENGGATVARAVLAGGRTVTVVGSGTGLTNDQLAEQGDAALALNLLGGHEHLVWYVAANVVDAQGTTPLSQLLPGWVFPAGLQLMVGVLLLALWQGRRFGPVVSEPLPVVVRAAEATEGRARLYRRAGARDRAAANLRAAALGRLIPLVGQVRSADPLSVTEAVAARTGRPAPLIGALLYGSAPADDGALVTLAHELDVLERMVRDR